MSDLFDGLTDLTPEVVHSVDRGLLVVVHDDRTVAFLFNDRLAALEVIDVMPAVTSDILGEKAALVIPAVSAVMS